MAKLERIVINGGLVPPTVFEFVDNSFNDTELGDLAYSMSVNIEDIPGETHGERAREFVEMCKRHGRMGELIATIKYKRPHVKKWDF